MRVILKIPGTLPNLNDYISAERSTRYKAAKMKADAEAVVLWQAKQQLRGVRFTKPVTMHYTWVERNKRRDQDNVSSFGRKVIQDALVKMGVLEDDGWNEIRGFSDTFSVDRDHPRIILVITDEEETHEEVNHAATAGASEHSRNKRQGQRAQLPAQ